MLTTELFIAIISLCITCFALGYTVGSKSNDMCIDGRSFYSHDANYSSVSILTGSTFRILEDTTMATINATSVIPMTVPTR